jgi:hypothetical protein
VLAAASACGQLGSLQHIARNIDGKGAVQPVSNVEWSASRGLAANAFAHRRIFQFGITSSSESRPRRNVRGHISCRGCRVQRNFHQAGSEAGCDREGFWEQVHADIRQLSHPAPAESSAGQTASLLQGSTCRRMRKKGVGAQDGRVHADGWGRRRAGGRAGE